MKALRELADRWKARGNKPAGWVDIAYQMNAPGLVTAANELEAALDALWIPVGERLPDNWFPVLVYDGMEVFEAGYFDGFWRVGGADCGEIICWMPLPEGPKVKP